MNNLVSVGWHLLAGLFIFGLGGLCFNWLPNSALYFAATLGTLLFIFGVLWLSLCSVDTKKDQQR